MNYKLMLICFLSFLPFIGDAQETKFNSQQKKEQITGDITVTGYIKDSTFQTPLEFGSVMLVNTETKAEKGLNSDSLGYFSFHGVSPGNYSLLVFYAGYPRFEKPVTILSSPKNVNLGEIFLVSENKNLKEVKIVSFRELIESRPDGIVYNAEKDGTNKGTTSDELLRKVPMLTVDLDGNVQMRGSSNVKVLIDGKPSTIIAASVKDALKQIPSDNIKSVEVITSPGAKYDAEGTSGVINIITKRNIIKGINGMTYTGLKYNFKEENINGHAGFNLNYRNNKFGISTYLGGGSWTNLSEASTIRTDFPGTPQEKELRQMTENSSRGQYFWGGLSADYDLDSLNSIHAGMNLNPGNWKSNIEQNTNIPGTNLNYLRRTDLETPSLGYSFNGSYNKKFKNNPKRTLDLLALYSINDRDNEYVLNQENLLNHTIDYREENKNKANNNEFTAQVDYAHPFQKHKQKLELGLKYINRKVGSDYQLMNSFSGNSDLILDSNRTNLLNYTQQVASAYGQFSTALAKNLMAIVGLRYEYTDIQASLRDHGGDFSNSFPNLLPSAILAWDLKNFQKLKVSYNQRIERPSINFINPYVNYSDPYNISSGNPELEPELIHNIELGYSNMFGQSTMNISTFFRRTNNAIESITTVGSDGVSRTNFGNIAQNSTWGANVFGSTRLFNKWSINLSGNLYYKNLYSPSLNLKNDGIEYDFHVYSSFQITDGFSIEGFGMYRGNQVLLQGATSGFYYYRLGLKKSVLNGKGDLTFGAENFLSPSSKVTTDYTYQNAIYHSENIRFNRGIRLGFSYRFGKMTFSGPKKSIKNDDLKDLDQQPQGESSPMSR